MMAQQVPRPTGVELMVHMHQRFRRLSKTFVGHAAASAEIRDGAATQAHHA